MCQVSSCVLEDYLVWGHTSILPRVLRLSRKIRNSFDSRGRAAHGYDLCGKCRLAIRLALEAKRSSRTSI